MGNLIKIATYNVCGLRFKYPYVRRFMREQGVDVLLATETQLMENILPLDRDKWIVSIVRQPRRADQPGRAHGGLALICDPTTCRDIKEVEIDSQGRWASYEVNGIRIIGVYIAPSITGEEEKRVIKEIGEKVPRKAEGELDEGKPTIILGDFNARVAKRHGEQSNGRGRLLVSTMAEVGMEIIRPREGPEMYSSTQGGQWYDLVMGNLAVRQLNHRVIHYHGWIGITNHCPVELTMEMLPRREQRRQIAPVDENIRWKTVKLENSLIKQEYRSELDRRMEELLPELRELEETALLIPRSLQERYDIIEKENKKFVDCVWETADAILGRVKGWNGTQRTVSSRQIRRLNKSIHSLLRQSSDGGTRAAKNRQQLIRSLMDNRREEIEKEMKVQWRQFAEEISATNVSEFLGTIKRIRRGRLRGIQAPMEQEDLDQIAEHYEQQFCPCEVVEGELSPKQMTTEKARKERVLGDPFITEIKDKERRLFTPQHILSLVRKTKGGKASGGDNICKELLALQGDNRQSMESNRATIKALSHIMRLAIRLGVTPNWWRRSYIVPLYKGKGAKRDWSNWRPVGLLSYMRKLMESGLGGIVTEKGFHPIQGGFRPEKSTLDQIASLHHAVFVARRQKKKVYMAFLDIWAAYDTVDRDILWEKCRTKGVPERTRYMLAEMTKETQMCIIGDNKQSKWFKARAGAVQGGTISPHLYNVFIDDLCVQLEKNGAEIVTADGKQLEGDLFADDVAIIATTPEGLRRALRLCEEHSRQNNYRWKPGKSKVIAEEETEVFHLYGEQLENVEVFVYLGYPIDKNGMNAEKLLQRNTKKAEQASEMMASLGVNAYGFQPHRTVVAWKMCVRSVLEYGMQISPFTEKQLQDLEKTHIKTLRRAIGGYNKSSREAMMQLAEAEPMSVRCTELQCRWLIHVFDAQENTSMVKRWLGDALQDKNSLVRSLIDRNELFQEHEYYREPQGPILRQLWGPEETMAEFVQMSKGRPWPGRADGAYLRRGTVKFSAEKQKDYRKRKRKERMEAEGRKGRGVLARDLPPNTANKSPLRRLTGSIKGRRELVGWWIGFFPSHRGGECGICGEQIPTENGARKHVAECVANISGSQLDPDAAETLRKLLPPDQQHRPDELDPITIGIWIMDITGKYGENDNERKRVFWALERVAEDCLGRNRPEVGDRNGHAVRQLHAYEPP
jgi:hypothetical protein